MALARIHMENTLKCLIVIVVLRSACIVYTLANSGVLMNALVILLCFRQVLSKYLRISALFSDADTEFREQSPHTECSNLEVLC